MPAKMTPPIRRGLLPPLHELDEYDFQGLCRDLFAEERSVEYCDDYGMRGQGQRGIDLEAPRRKPGEIEVAQVKRYQTITDKQIRKASDEFLQHEDHWKERGAKRFILMVSCRVNRTECREEIERERQRFQQKGIRYECWDRLRIRNKLRPHRQIAATYFEAHWVEFVCGRASAGTGAAQYPSGAARIVAVAFADKIENLAVRLSDETEQRLEEQREALRVGKIDKAQSWVRKTKSDTAFWSALSDRVKAKILRFEAGLALASAQDVHRAEALVDEARALVPDDDQRHIRAFIAYWRKGHKAALEELGDADGSDDLNFKAALLLELGRAQEAIEVGSKIADNGEGNAEYLRIRALAKTALRDLQGAHTDIEKAFALQPNWTAIRRARGIVLYYSSIHSPAPPGRIEPWPEPVDWQLVQQDPSAIDRIRKAEEIFSSLTKEKPIQRSEKRIDEIWRLACLAIDPDRQDEAQQYCQQLLSCDSCNYRALSWALARAYDIDFKKSVRALSRKVDASDAELGEILGLIGCYVFSDQAQRALKVLDHVRGRFKNRHEKVLWQLWSAQALVRAGQGERARSLIGRSEYREELRHVKAMVLAAQAQESGNWEPVVKHLRESYDKTGDGRFLIQEAHVRADLKQWDLIADYADELASAVGSEEALRLAAFGLFNSHRYEDCLTLLDRRVKERGEGALTGELRRMRFACQRELGDLAEAISQAEILAAEEPLRENLLQLAQTYFTAGDLLGVARVGRQLADDKELNIEDAIRLSILIKDADPILSRKLWRKAAASDVPDELVGAIVNQGFAMNLESEATPFLQRLQELGTSGSKYVKAVNLEDAIKFFREQQRNLNWLSTLYDSGSVPVHTLVRGEFLAFSTNYHGLLLRNESHPRPAQQPHLLFRHGGRGFPKERVTLPRNCRLNVDLTALLLSAHLGILDAVEETFGSIRIPHDLVAALIQMRHRLEPHQPSRLDAIRKVIELLGSGHIKTVELPKSEDEETVAFQKEVGPEIARMSVLARDGAGYAVCHLPLRKLDLSGSAAYIPHGCKTRLVKCGAVLEALKKTSALSATEYRDAKSALGNEGRVAPGASIKLLGVNLYCCDRTAELLAVVGLLDRVSTEFNLVITSDEARQFHGEFQAFEARKEMAEWLDELIAHCHARITSGRYEVLPTITRPPSDTDRRGILESSELRCLLGLLQCQPEPRDRFWSDDRGVNAYPTINGAPLFTILEILKILLDRKKLRTTTFYEILHRLRASNVRFIPVTGEEIARCLKEAAVRSGVIQETPQLATLRRYVSACLLRSDILQKPPLPEKAPNPQGETAFFLSLIHSAHDALLTVWAEPRGSADRRRKRSEWILHNIFVDVGGVRQIVGLAGPGDDPTYLASLSLSHLISLGLQIGTRIKKDGQTRRKEYLEWLFRSAPLARLEGKPELIQAIASSLKEMISDILGADSLPEVARATSIATSIHVARQFLEDLPLFIHNEIEKDGKFLALLGLRTLQVVHIGDLAFEHRLFWEAANRALSGKRPTITTVDGQSKARISASRVKSGSRALTVTQIGTRLAQPVDAPELVLLRGPKSSWDRFIRENRQIFDGSNVQLAQIQKSLRKAQSPAARIEFVMRYRKQSMALFYARLPNILLRPAGFRYDDLFPDEISSIIRHLRLEMRLSKDTSFPERLQAAVAQVISEEGVAQAFDRFSGLPIPFAESFHSGVRGLAPEKRRQLIKRWIRVARSPVARGHLIHVLYKLGDDTPAYPRLSRSLLRQMARDGRSEIDVFRHLLEFAHDRFINEAKSLGWSSEMLIVATWSHAHRLFTASRIAGVSLRQIGSTFQTRPRPLTPDLFDRRSYDWDDVLHPNRITTDNLLLGVLAYAVEAAPSKLVAAQTRELLSRMSVCTAEGQQIPNAALMRDPSNLRNRIGSFMGGDRTESYARLIRQEIATGYGATTLKNYVMKHARQITEGENVLLGWTVVHAIAAHSTPYRGLIRMLERAVLATDFSELYQQDPSQTSLALNAASALLLWDRNSKARIHLESQIRAVAGLVGRETNPTRVGVRSDKNAQSEWYGRVQLLLDSAMNIAAQRPSEEETAKCFADLLASMLSAYEPMIEIIKSVAFLLWCELPPELARMFAPIVARTRAA